MTNVKVFAEITGITYKPFLCRELRIYKISNLDLALSSEGSFLLDIDGKNCIALSWWVSPKRTRSYPYARVYNTLCFQGKKVTIIPIIKDEGVEGDRDFLQWDTISLMSLLGIYTIISYYCDAKRSKKYQKKLTDQKFDIDHIRTEIKDLLNYKSDPLHWNLSKVEKAGEIAKKALDSYERISKELDIKLHSRKTAERRIDELLKGKERFINLSRNLAEKAQKREVITIQPKENLSGNKATLTIKNYLGGYYFFTCDEVIIEESTIYLIEGKHSRQALLPSLDDIKDGLIKMILYTNLKNVRVEDITYNHKPILKLTTNTNFSVNNLQERELNILRKLKQEAMTNGFQVIVNDFDLQNVKI